MSNLLLVLLTAISSLFKNPTTLRIENLAFEATTWRLASLYDQAPELTATDRLFGAWLSRVCVDWRSTLTIIKPETVVGWRRKGFRLFWRWKIRHGKRGRPTVSREVRDLIRTMSRANPLWGVPRIHGDPCRSKDRVHRSRGICK